MPAGQLSDGMNVVDSSSIPNIAGSPSSTNSAASLEEQNEDIKTEPTESDSNKENNDEWIDILGSGQLKMKTIKKGEPDTRPQPNDICEIRLKGSLEDGSVVENFDSAKIQLGCHEVVQGVELAVPLMNVGEEAVVVVAARFGYGSLGNPPTIPPNATITYDIALVNATPEPDLEQIPFDKRKILASNKKERGNWWYSRHDATKAIQCYRRALDILDETVVFSGGKEGETSTEYTEEQMRDIIEQKLIIYNNMAAAQLQVEAYDSALMSVSRVLQCDPKNVKALFRKGKILTAKGQIDEAVDALRQALTLEQDNSAIKIELSRCVKLQQTEKQHEKNLYRKMFGQNKKGEKIESSKKRKRSWPRLLGTAASATVIAVIAFAVCYKFKNYSFL